jgi:hypothetical protein
MSFNTSETAKLQSFLQKKFGQSGLTLRDRKTADSLEVLLNGEFIGVVYKDEEDGEVSYDFNMAILDIDLEDA